ncbi:anaerobic ribonucleoside-triphosphate reductase activating protein [Heliorestis convoluta]|uniref:Anaerobic ribonucleoside-triphosphate reductase-activating protein n=1 Tax=Heliorestis convoluta TaxID=356322 RepID=A0A5Q2N0S6_9FIRM|nr:anaerobic ribonucleoside-triphosphate reductase activating protein [Heliorestis convoluta]QGG47931.1 anaerobic ribonucleoside-triphosphate reductase activating protein [Heliorestis convoluta]
MITLRLAGIVKDSIVDGPGIRATLFAQGCLHHCPGCHNPQTHDLTKGQEMSIDEIVTILEKTTYLDGVTFSGGEPFLQAQAFALLGQKIRARGMHLIIYTGYTFEQIIALAEHERSYLDLLEQANWLIDGLFREEEKDLSLPFRGSRNQRIIDVKESIRTGNVIPVMD